MRGFGDPIQYSVFQCDLLPAERIMMIEALTEIINHKEDRILIVDVGPSKGRRKRIETLGKQLITVEKNAIIA
jgi:CRISPR-associated protein Cas2